MFLKRSTLISDKSKKKINKHSWTYTFLYWNCDKPKIIEYKINTNEGFKVAESAAWGNATWDGCNHLMYKGRKKESRG